MPTEDISLLLSMGVYHNDGEYPVPGWLEVSKSESTTGFFARAYRSTNNSNEIVIAFRGYQNLLDLDDVGSAYAGQVFEQMMHAQAFYDSVKEQNQSSTISTTGHSLGGALAGVVFSPKWLIERDEFVFVISDLGLNPELARQR